MKVACCKRFRLLFQVLYLTLSIPNDLLSTAIRWYRDYWSGREELLSASTLSPQRSNAESTAINFAHFDYFRRKSLQSFFSESGCKGKAVFRTVTAKNVDDCLLKGQLTIVFELTSTVSRFVDIHSV
jgi:hypothetical protein